MICNELFEQVYCFHCLYAVNLLILGSGSQNALPLGNLNIQNQAPPTKSKKDKKEKEKEKKNKKDKKGSKLSKAAIGAPSGFT